MGLSCECGDWEDFEWYFTAQEFAPLVTKYRRRCKSCNRLIDHGEECLEYTRRREPITDVEEKIFGGGPDVPMASWYHCECCGELYTMLSDLGFCMDIDENMNDLLKEYQESYAHRAWRPPESK